LYKSNDEEIVIRGQYAKSQHQLNKVYDAGLYYDADSARVLKVARDNEDSGD
jgi:hypothetical protein